MSGEGREEAKEGSWGEEPQMRWRWEAHRTGRPAAEGGTGCPAAAQGTG